MSIYDELDIDPLINAYGTVTRIGGSLMPRDVLRAMDEASRQFVDVNELLEKSGRYLADLIGVEAALITSGAAAGLTVSTAACVAGTDPRRIERLPDTEGMADEVVVLKSHRFRYDQAVRQAGANLVEVGLGDRSHPRDVERAIGEDTAAILYLQFDEFETRNGSLPLQDVLAVGVEHVVPVIVDAAAEIPPPSNLARFNEMGADLVVFSGGKAIRGPQSSGLILGRADLIEACALNNYPRHSIGRPMKADKETIAGLVKAVELYLERDFNAQVKRWDQVVDYWLGELSDLDGVEVEAGYPDEPGIQPSIIPRVYLRWDGSGPDLTMEQVQRKLRNGHPRIAVGHTDKGLVLNPQTLRDDEEKIVARRVREVLE